VGGAHWRLVAAGYGSGMTEHPDAERVESRAAHLTPEEAAAGSDDARRQAEIILEDSDARTADPERIKRESTQTPD
jgi:hypothetical protein